MQKSYDFRHVLMRSCLVIFFSGAIFLFGFGGKSI